MRKESWKEWIFLPEAAIKANISSKEMDFIVDSVRPQPEKEIVRCPLICSLSIKKYFGEQQSCVLV